MTMAFIPSFIPRTLGALAITLTISGAAKAAPIEAAGFKELSRRPIIYQLTVRNFGNAQKEREIDGELKTNGVGKFEDVNDEALASLSAMGFTHIWLTGVLRQATLTDYTSVDPRLTADDPDVVKGRAGSYYAIRDYYDVSPDYAVRPENRLEEFQELIARVKSHGFKVLIDFVPNHVARSYASVVYPERDFGVSDDKSFFYLLDNNFYYLQEGHGRGLSFKRPDAWQPEGLAFDGRFGPEDGSCPAPEICNVPRVTGERDTALDLTTNSWYETVKLNYGYDFLTSGEPSRLPHVPDTWEKLDQILAYWQAMGVDGFRCDFAHVVPNVAWQYLIDRARSRDTSVFFMAEAYASEHRFAEMLSSGFDSLYYDASYDTLKRVYQGSAGKDDYKAILEGLQRFSPYYVQYLENHDERRIASPVVTSGSPEDSGFGQAAAAYQLAPLQYLAGRGPVLFYNGQETGERAEGREGFGGDDGRTSIFDYGSMPSFVDWIGSDHSYQTSRLSPEIQNLRAYYGDLLHLARQPVFADGQYYWLNADSPLFSFARYRSGIQDLRLVLSNFAYGGELIGRVQIPWELLAWAGLSGVNQIAVELQLDGEGRQARLLGSYSPEQLATEGLPYAVSNQSAQVLRLTPTGPH